MKVTFPYMGTVIIYKKLLELLGHDVIVPPRPSKKTFDLGVKFSPEFACFPYKAIMGSYMEACERGADTIITSGGHGPCRAGFYSEIHKRELEKLNYNVDFIVFDSFFYDKQKFFARIRKLRGKHSWVKVIRIIRLVYRMIQEIDKLDKKIHKIMPYEVNAGQTDKVWGKIQQEFDKVTTKKELKKVVQKANEMIASIERYPVESDKKIKIGIVGEIYVVMEPSVNMDIEKVIGELGCEVEKSHYLSDWISHHVLPSFLKGSHEENILKKGEQFIEIEIGGHAKQSVGHIIDFKERGFDGIIHLMPFGCLPELISQSIIPKISQDYNIPVLTISLDEQTGQANNRTRIEAFVDLVKSKSQYSKEYIAPPVAL